MRALPLYVASKRTNFLTWFFSGTVYRGKWNEMDVAIKVMRGGSGDAIPRAVVRSMSHIIFTGCRR